MNDGSKTRKSFFRRVERFLRKFIPYPSQNTLRRWFPKFEERNIAYLLGQAGVDAIIDVGAHKGEFATKMRCCGFKGRIISFEPVRSFHNALLRKSRNDQMWDVAAPMALGAASAELEIKVMGTLSSFHETVSPSEHTSELVPVRTLDDVIDGFGLSASSRIALKLDVQGFEMDVLEGALKTLDRVRAVLIEVSLRPVYVGEIYYLEMLSYLREKGFYAVYFAPVVNKPKLGEMWQVDALLIKRDGAPEGQGALSETL